MKSGIEARATVTRHMVLFKSAVADYEFEPLDEIRIGESSPEFGEFPNIYVFDTQNPSEEEICVSASALYSLA